MKIQIEKIRDEKGNPIHTIRERKVKINSMYLKDKRHQIIQVFWDRDPNFGDEGFAFIQAGNAICTYHKEYSEALGLDKEGKSDVNKIIDAKVTRYYFTADEKAKISRLVEL
jgi:hypothetical protein